MSTFGDHIEELKKQGKDFAYVVRWRFDGKENQPVEVNLIWLEPGKYPTQFPERTTDQMRALKEHWDEKWTIIRCAPQPAKATISLAPGRFLPGGMPDVEF